MNLAPIMLSFMLLFTGCSGSNTNAAAPSATESSIKTEAVQRAETTMTNDYFSADSLVSDVINHPAFEGFGRYIFPVKNRSSYDSSMQIGNIGSLLPYHRAIQTETTLEVLNYMLDEVSMGNTLFYDIYSELEKQVNSGKTDTGLFFFRGEPDAPFAIICAGGGFSYVGSIHESFPHALELSKQGYNAFAIEYRLGSNQAATEDLAAAVSFIFENAEALGVSTEYYSIWGGSAGARMAANIGSYGVAAFGGDEVPGPSAVIIAYTGHSDYTANDTPTFTMVSENDSIVNASIVDRRVENMVNAGIDVEYQKYSTAGHGFGLGIGTDAEGWMDDAIQFWEKHQADATT